MVAKQMVCANRAIYNKGLAANLSICLAVACANHPREEPDLP
jgi:hypothetical protein